MAYLYFLLAVLGAIVPYGFFVQHFSAEGLALTAFVDGLFANGAAAGFSADVLISSLAFWVFLWHRGVARLWMFVLINLSIGLSCALPLYLALETRARATARVTA